MSPPPENWCARVRNVLVSGASRGLGLGIAQRLAASGFNVIALARRPTDMFEAAAADIAQAGAGALQFHAFDLAETAEIPALVKRLRREYGPLFGLVNNAGQSLSGMLTNAADERIAQLVQVNILSPIILTKYVARAMMSGNGGRVVNISSIVGATGYSGLSVYAATKASLDGFTRSLARELGPLGVTVNAVAPGFVDTDLTGELTQEHREKIARRSALRRMVGVADVANAVDFLFSESARNITGTVMTVDAGNTA